VRRTHAAWVIAPAVIALVAAAPASGAPAGPAPAHAEVAAKKRKPVTCKSTQLRITVRGKVRCRALPRRAGAAVTPVASLRAAIRRDPGTVRSRGGKVIRSIWRAAGGRMQRVRTRLLRALTRVAARANGVARAAVTGDRRCADGPASRFDAEGFSVGIAADGTTTMSVGAGGGYRVDVTLGGLVECSDIELKDCPMPDGRLDGRDGRGQRLGVRVTKDGALVQNLQTTVRSTQKLTGTVADDAKLDRIKVEDTARQTITYQVPGVSIALTIALQGTAEVNMRSGTVIPGTARITVSPATTAAAADAGRAGEDYARTFLQLVDVERETYRRREHAWQTPGACAKVTHDPATSALGELEQDATGSVTAKIEANAGGEAAKARWIVTGVANGTITPPTVQGAGSAPFRWTVTRAGRGIRLAGKWRATSTAGVAEATWSQATKAAPADAYFRIDAVGYSASHTGSFSGDSLPCAISGSPNESLTSGPLPFVPDQVKLTENDGTYAGTIITGPEPLQATRSGTGDGCDISSSEDPPPACSVPFSVSVPVAIGVIVQISANAFNAKVTWVLPPVGLGDGTPPFPCYRPTTLGAVPGPEERQEPAGTFLDPGTHTISVTRNVAISAPAPGLSQNISGTTSASITFTRVNADGSPYTG
jgi:hypothetical protein